MAAVEFVDSRQPLRPFTPQGSFATAVTRAALGQGVITRALPASDTVSFSPPFVVTPEELERMVAGVRAGFDQALAERRGR